MNSSQTAFFMDHIRRHALQYYPSLGSAQICVDLLERQERPSAMLYRFKVSSGTQIRSVFVKVPLRRSAADQPQRRTLQKPLLFPRAESQDMHRLQYTALRTIYDHFSGLNKKQLGAIRVLDYLPQYHAIFMEELSDPRLRQLFLRSNRLYAAFTPDELVKVFRNVGTWLRIYHAMPKEEDVKVRHAHREDYIEGITRLTDFLARTLGDDSFFWKTAAVLAAQACETLPELLPLGLGHGDYAMRNILIGPHARVTVLDTLAKWRTPIYEDIGYFLNELKMSYPQVVSQGLAFRSDQLTAYEDAFLEGYFDQAPVPCRAIRLYEMLALLDKLSSTITKIHQQSYFARSAGWLKMIWISTYFKRRIKRLLSEIATG